MVTNATRAALETNNSLEIRLKRALILNFDPVLLQVLFLNYVFIIYASGDAN